MAGIPGWSFIQRMTNGAMDRVKIWMAHCRPRVNRSDGRPTLLLLADRRHWAFDHAAQAIAQQLDERFRIDIRYVIERPVIRPEDYDLIHIFFWGETWHRRFDCDPRRIVKEVWSNRWRDDPRYGPCTPATLASRHLCDAGTVTVTSERMRSDLGNCHPQLHLTPNGVDTQLFRPLGERSGAIRVGWAGNPTDPVKRFALIEQACLGRFDLAVAGGTLRLEDMNEFYNRIDVFILASLHEGDPLPLLEAMAAGCFPVCTDVGIVREVITDGENGLIIDGSVTALQDALGWCETQIDRVRKAGQANAQRMVEHRRWAAVAPRWAATWNEAIARADLPFFRNDDVGWDTDLKRFTEFCAVFARHGYTQVHGLTLRGRVSTLYQQGDDPSEYPDERAIVRLDNRRIRALSAPFRIEDRPELITYLAEMPDDIALHGLFHTDYSRMTADEQRQDIAAGLDLLAAILPHKPVRYFIPPFNRINRHTRRVCREFGLHILATDGIHLEAELERTVIVPRSIYRYHHHRFYPESTFTYYPLDLTRLDTALGRSRG